MVIFLDIDGVLNTGRYACWLYKNKKPHRDEFGHLFCPQSVANVEELVHQTGAKVVISSVWRKSGLSVMKDLFKVRGIDVDVIDVTPWEIIERPDGSSRFRCRGGDIEEWLLGNDWVSQYLIIDDDADMLPDQLPFFVRTNPETGFTKKCLKKALSILNVVENE